MKRYRRFLLLLAMLPATTFAIAQNITGRIIDEQSQPMPFANVVLVNRTDSVFIAGAVTKDDGTFSISTDKQDGLLKVSSVGYIIKYIVARQGNVGDIQMQPDIQPEETIVLKGKKKYYISVMVVDSDRYGILDMQSQLKTSYYRVITKGKKRKLPIGPAILVKGYEIEQ